MAGRRCVVVGAGPVGGRRARILAGAGAEVTVVAPVASPEVEAMALEGTLTWERRTFVPADAAEAFLVVAATDDPAVNGAVADSAPPGTLVARADHAPSTDVTFPSVVERGPVTVTVATSGRAPVVGRWLADRIDERLDEVTGLDADGLALLVDLAAELRPGGGAGVTPAAGDWRSALRRSMLDAVLLDLIRSGDRAAARERLRTCLSSS
ncbi:MAG: precorrin-2 dehydrogenase/sirohydrochlorin ferrochelatase family protein [Microthrixaceae bacterium]